MQEYLISNYCNSPLHLKPARSFAPAPEAPTLWVAPGCSTQPWLRQHQSYPNATQSARGKQGKTLGLAKPSPANTRAADKPVWSRRLVVLSCLRRERKQDAWSSPSIGMGAGGRRGARSQQPPAPCLAGVICRNKWGLFGGESREESGAVQAAVTHGAVNHTGGPPGALEPLATSPLSAATQSHDLMGFPCSPWPRRAPQCLAGVTAPEEFLLLSASPCIALLRLNSGNFSQKEGFLPLISIRGKIWGYPFQREHPGGPNRVPPQPSPTTCWLVPETLAAARLRSASSIPTAP